MLQLWERRPTTNLSRPPRESPHVLLPSRGTASSFPRPESPAARTLSLRRRRCRCPENTPNASPRGRPIRLGETPSNPHLTAPKREVWSSREDTDVAEAQAGTATRNKEVTRPQHARHGHGQGPPVARPGITPRGSGGAGAPRGAVPKAAPSETAQTSGRGRAGERPGSNARNHPGCARPRPHGPHEAQRRSGRRCSRSRAGLGPGKAAPARPRTVEPRTPAVAQVATAGPRDEPRGDSAAGTPRRAGLPVCAGRAPRPSSDQRAHGAPGATSPLSPRRALAEAAGAEPDSRLRPSGRGQQRAAAPPPGRGSGESGSDESVARTRGRVPARSPAGLGACGRTGRPGGRGVHQRLLPGQPGRGAQLRRGERGGPSPPEPPAPRVTAERAVRAPRPGDEAPAPRLSGAHGPLSAPGPGRARRERPRTPRPPPQPRTRAPASPDGSRSHSRAAAGRTKEAAVTWGRPRPARRDVSTRRPAIDSRRRRRRRLRGGAGGEGPRPWQPLGSGRGPEDPRSR